MLDLSSNMASNRKMDGLGVSGVLILGGFYTKFDNLPAAILDFTLQ